MARRTTEVDWDGLFEFDAMEGVAAQTILDAYAVELEDEKGELPPETPPYPGIRTMRHLAIRELLNGQGPPRRGPR